MSWLIPVSCIAVVVIALTATFLRPKDPLPPRLLFGARDCGTVKLLPNSWLLPFGLDKLKTSLDAERRRRFPSLCFEEHERHGDTYAQHAGGQYIVLTRDPRNIRAVLLDQFKRDDNDNVIRGRRLTRPQVFIMARYDTDASLRCLEMACSRMMG
jgi:hypothetical protein